jgi:hypothetical protein
MGPIIVGENIRVPSRRKQSDRARPTERKPNARSTITNGSRLLGSKGCGFDERSVWARRFRDLIDLHVADLGGFSNVTAAQLSIIRRVAVTVVELENMERRFATDGCASPHSLDLYFRGAGNLRRLLESIGLERRARDITPLSATNTKHLPAGTPLREVLDAEVITHER